VIRSNGGVHTGQSSFTVGVRVLRGRGFDDDQFIVLIDLDRLRLEHGADGVSAVGNLSWNVTTP